jgi:hypothetical protein
MHISDVWTRQVPTSHEASHTPCLRGLRNIKHDLSAIRKLLVLQCNATVVFPIHGYTLDIPMASISATDSTIGGTFCNDPYCARFSGQS